MITAAKPCLGSLNWRFPTLARRQIIASRRSKDSLLNDEKAYMSSRILLVEDAPDVQAIVRSTLKGLFDLTVAGTIAEATTAIARRSYDLILLDALLPDGDGFAFCANLQNNSEHKDTPVFFLTGKTSVDDRVQGFQLGADDYITKTFEPREVRARITAKIKKNSNRRLSEAVVKKGDLSLNLLTQVAVILVSGKEEVINLSRLEFKLLNHFIRFENQVFSREQLMDSVWGKDLNVLDRTVDTHVSHLRKKISASEYTIGTVHGSGYTFQLKATDSKHAA